MKRDQIWWSVSLPNCDQVASKVQFDRLKDRRKKTFIQALLFCFSYHDYLASVFYSKQIYSARLVVGSFCVKSTEKPKYIYQ